MLKSSRATHSAFTCPGRWHDLGAGGAVYARRLCQYPCACMYGGIWWWRRRDRYHPHPALRTTDRGAVYLCPHPRGASPEITAAGNSSTPHAFCNRLVENTCELDVEQAMKIIIVGAGVAGLSTYLQLRKVLPNPDLHTILIYESHGPRKTAPQGTDSSSPPLQHDMTDTAAVVGNSIALVPSTMRLLKYIDPRLYEIFRLRGYVNEAYTFKTARGHLIAVTPTGDNGSPPEHTVSCPRYGLWECLHEVVGEDNIHNREVVQVDLSGKRPTVRFADGGLDDADMVVGADGVRSVVKKALFGREDERRYAPHYE